MVRRTCLQRCWRTVFLRPTVHAVASSTPCRLGQIFVAADSAKPRLIFNNVQSQVGGCQVPESRFSARPSFHLRLSVDMPYTVPGLRSWIRGLHSRRATLSILAGQSGKRAEELLVKKHKQPRVRSPSKSTCSGAINLLIASRSSVWRKSPRRSAHNHEPILASSSKNRSHRSRVKRAPALTSRNRFCKRLMAFAYMRLKPGQAGTAALRER